MNNPLVIMLSTFISVILTISTFPLGYLSPDWMLLIILYWMIAVPSMYNLYTVWLIGIIADVTVGSILGMNALVYIFLSFIVKKLHKSLRYFTIIQQSVIILIVFLIKVTFLIWIDSLLGSEIFNIDMYFVALSSALLWPAVFYSLRYFRRRYNIA